MTPVQSRALATAIRYAEVNGLPCEPGTPVVGLILAGMAIGASLPVQAGAAIVARYSEDFPGAPIDAWRDYITNGLDPDRELHR